MQNTIPQTVESESEAEDPGAVGGMDPPYEDQMVTVSNSSVQCTDDLAVHPSSPQTGQIGDEPAVGGMDPPDGNQMVVLRESSVQCTDDLAGHPIAVPAGDEAAVGAVGGVDPSDGHYGGVAMRNHVSYHTVCEDSWIEDQLRKLEQENQRLRERLLCEFCRVRRFQMFLLICRHKICKHCRRAIQQERCPCCKTKIQGIVNISPG